MKPQYLLAYLLIALAPLVLAQDLQFNLVTGSPVLGPINCLAIDGRGVKWAGTEQGLLTIDGALKKLYTPNNSALRDGHINCLLIDSQGNKWMGSYTKGLMRLDSKGKFHHYPFADARILLITGIAIDGLQQVWVSTSEGGIYQLEGEQLLRKYHAKSAKLPSNTIYALGFLPSGKLWAGTPEGLCLIEGDKVTTIKALKGVRGLLANASEQIAGGLGLGGPMLWRKEKNDWEQVTDFCNPLPPLNNMIQGNDFFWITTEEGLLRFNGRSCKRFDQRHGLEFSTLTSVAQDLDSTLWVGTAQGQIFQLAPALPLPALQSAIAIDSNSIRQNETMRLVATQFQQGTALLVDSMATLQELTALYEYWKKSPDLHLEVEGHTDNRGSQIENWKLSRERAEGIGSLLVALGMPEEVLIIGWQGEAEPIVPNNTEAHRAKNRRVEFRFISE